MNPSVLPMSRFEQPVVGPAYRPITRWCTVSFVIGLMGYGAYVLGRRPDVATPVLGLMAVAAMVVLISAWYILTGKTTIDRDGIRQDWIFPKSYRWHEIIRARFIRMPFSARLMVITGKGPIRAVHSGSRVLDDAFRDIALFYATRKGG